MNSPQKNTEYSPEIAAQLEEAFALVDEQLKRAETELSVAKSNDTNPYVRLTIIERYYRMFGNGYGIRFRDGRPQSKAARIFIQKKIPMAALDNNDKWRDLVKKDDRLSKEFVQLIQNNAEFMPADSLNDVQNWARQRLSELDIFGGKR